MELIPVIDVKGGRAVHAVRGQRADYRPLTTPLAVGSDPVDIVQGLRRLYPFRTLYVADLDGIEGRGADTALPGRVAAAAPGVELWLDSGLHGATRCATTGHSSVAASRLDSDRDGQSSTGRHDGEGAHPRLDKMAGSDAITIVMGSESLDAEALAALRRTSAAGYVLSLDFKGDAYCGPQELLDDAELWPERVIVMTLARVGSAEGPDLDRIATIAAKAGKARRVYAAGGIRDRADIEAARSAGASGALIATALHTGTITAGVLEEIAGR